MLIVAAALLLAVVPSPTRAQPAPVPVFAYYYIWFTPGSWDRAKTDYPILGRYSSDDPAVMREHVRLAKLAGIDGFIVSWKSTEVLNKRLQQLIDISEEEDFKLAIIYQGLNFERRPLPAEQIAADLDHFIEEFADSHVFDVYPKPVVIWSGTWEFKRQEIHDVTGPRKSQLLILASERSVEGYQRVQDSVDGNAYYWSSVDPQTFPGYQQKLDDMSAEVHTTGGLWVAPAAPGFDARLLDGTRVVERRHGRTLQDQFNAASRSNPDMIGIISWNEFSENSHIEPSVEYGARSLHVLADMRGASVPDVPFFESDGMAQIEGGVSSITLNGSRLILLGLMGGVALGSLAVVVRRSNREVSNE